MTTAQGAFTNFGLASQALLAAFFAARRRWPRRADRLGRAAYALAAPGCRWRSCWSSTVRACGGGALDRRMGAR
jgi:hypothetical protein